MAKAKKSPDLTYTVGGVSQRHLLSLDEAMAEAARMSIDIGHKWVSIFVHAHTPTGAKIWGGLSAVEHFDNTPADEPLASIAIKAEDRGYNR